MKARTLLVICIVALSAVPAAAQLVVPGTDEVARQPTQVLILRDGEQLVVRGGYEVKGVLTFFYYDHGSYPVYASIATEKIDLDATVAANEKLKRERLKRANYYKLIEERRRRILEEEDQEQPSIVTVEGENIMVQPSGTTVAPKAATAEFPQYEENDVVNRPENWWRGEAQKLFSALNESNARMRSLSQQNDQLTMLYNRARTDTEARSVQMRMNDVRSKFAAEREQGRLIGNRLAQLSDWAEQLSVPLDWIIPDGSTIIDESPNQPVANQPADKPGRSSTEYEPKDYSAPELRNVSDSWWTREMSRLRVDREDAESRLNSLRNRYNALVTEREKTESEGQRLALTQQIDTVSGTIRSEEQRLADVNTKIQRLTDAARELGKEEVLGLMSERKDQ